MKPRPGMDEVFAKSVQDELEFDTIFDYEDSLIDTVNGVNEAGDPLTGVDFVDLHQVGDESSAKDVRDYDPADNPMGAKNAEGTQPIKPDDVSYSASDLSKMSDGDKFVQGTDDDYQDGKDNGKPNVDPQDIGASIGESFTDGFEKELGYERSFTEEFEEEMEDEMDDEEDFEEGCKKEACKQEACKKEACGAKQEGCKKEACGTKQEACKKESGCMTDEFEDEIEQEGCKKACKEASDIDGVIADEDDDLDIIDNLVAPKQKLTYDPSDEDLILAAMGMD